LKEKGKNVFVFSKYNERCQLPLAELKSRNGKLPLEQGWLETWEERRIRWALATTEKPEVTVPDIQARAGQFLEPPIENDGIEWNSAL
jgi:hypothetical protein